MLLPDRSNPTPDTSVQHKRIQHRNAAHGFENQKAVPVTEPSGVYFDDPPDLEAERAADEQEKMRTLCDWLSGERATEFFGQAFSRRLVALGWTADPSKFEGMSQSDVAAANGMTKQQLSIYAAEATRIFELKNRGQRAHAARRQKKR